MTNKDIASTFNLLGKVMELHGENPFKIRSYFTVYNLIRKLPEPIIDKSKEELLSMKGVGKAIADKILELRDTGKLNTLEKYLEQTPPGIVEMMAIKGLGSKKLMTVWRELGIESPGELLYACQENRLVELKGFGNKTQEDIKRQIEYYLDSRGKYLYGHVFQESLNLLLLLKGEFPSSLFSLTKEIRRKMPVVVGIEVLSTVDEGKLMSFIKLNEDFEYVQDKVHYMGIRIHFTYCVKSEFYLKLFLQSGSDEFIDAWKSAYSLPELNSEKDYFISNKLAFIPPETREGSEILLKANKVKYLDIVDYSDIKGVVHTHTTYSDGANTLREMIEASREEGYEYIVISDHSKAAFYANGLTEERLYSQWEEIDDINNSLHDFKIFKGIECDILNDGDLDYNDDFLENLDLIIASVHSNLKMSGEKANHRLLRAIQNRHTRILGHPTGRLLLSRKGYPIDHELIIDACAENNVVIEINASPYRLDLDWTWIDYAQERGVIMSINPDAHSTAGIGDIRFGVDAARKGALKKASCLNCKGVREFEEWIYNS